MKWKCKAGVKYVFVLLDETVDSEGNWREQIEWTEGHTQPLEAYPLL